MRTTPWDKTFVDGNEYDDNWNIIGESDEKDDAYYTFCPQLSADAPQIEGYCPSPADFLITEAKYSTFAIDLSQSYYYDGAQGVFTNEFVLFE